MTIIYEHTCHDDRQQYIASCHPDLTTTSSWYLHLSGTDNILKNALNDNYIKRLRENTLKRLNYVKCAVKRVD